MQEKEIEKILQEKADKFEMREFSQVWEEIKGEIEQPEKQKKKIRWKKWLPMALASAVLVVCIALSPMIIKALKPAPPNEEVFYNDELTSQEVLENEMLEGLADAQIAHVNLGDYLFDGCKLLVTEDNKIKGASATIYNNPTTFFAEMIIYHKSVDADIKLATYDTQCKVNSADVYYKLKQESGGMYQYNVYAVYNKVQYVIEYTGFSNNLTEFLNDFFA